jgi:hypothetical protein
MSTIESNIKNQPIISNSASSSSSTSQSVIPPPLLLPTTTSLAPTPSLPLPSPPPPTPYYDDKSTEKCYKKEKQILIEFDQIVKGIKRICPFFSFNKYITSEKKQNPIRIFSPPFIKYIGLYRVLYINTHTIVVLMMMN